MISSERKESGVARLYVYKCRNDPDTEFSAYGDWLRVFEAAGPVAWGGVWATQHPTSIEIFESEIQPGDLILAWQTDKHAAVGVAEVVGFEMRGQDRQVLLEAREEFPRPVQLHKLKKSTNPELNSVSALKQGKVATIYRTDHSEARALLNACSSRYAGLV